MLVSDFLVVLCSKTWNFPFLWIDGPISQQAKRAKEEEISMDIDEDMNEVITDPAFLQSVLENLPGVDPQSEAIRDVVGSLNKDNKNDKETKDGSG